MHKVVSNTAFEKFGQATMGHDKQSLSFIINDCELVSCGRTSCTSTCLL